MEDFIIDVSALENLQTIKDIQSLDLLFDKAKVTIVRGGAVALVRTQHNGTTDQFESYSTLEDLDQYKQNVYKYL